MNASSIRSIGTVVGLMLLISCAGPTHGPPVRTVPSVDLARYTGIWYEIARYQNRFQEGCHDTTATYTLRPDGEITVVNRCLKGTEGQVAEATGRAWLAEPPKLHDSRSPFSGPSGGITGSSIWEKTMSMLLSGPLIGSISGS
jgi:apolipoprotein D and lipocalin family protein